MFRRSGPNTLGEYARTGYSLLRDVRPSTVRQYVIVADLFERWAGGPVQLDQLDERSVSEWLRDYSASRKPATVRERHRDEAHAMRESQFPTDLGLTRHRAIDGTAVHEDEL